MGRISEVLSIFGTLGYYAVGLNPLLCFTALYAEMRLQSLKPRRSRSQRETYLWRHTIQLDNLFCM